MLHDISVGFLKIMNTVTKAMKIPDNIIAINSRLDALIIFF